MVKVHLHCPKEHDIEQTALFTTKINSLNHLMYKRVYEFLFETL